LTPLKREKRYICFTICKKKYQKNQNMTFVIKKLVEKLYFYEKFFMV